jgi:hypothetical protein
MIKSEFEKQKQKETISKNLNIVLWINSKNMQFAYDPSFLKKICYICALCMCIDDDKQTHYLLYFIWYQKVNNNAWCICQDYIQIKLFWFPKLLSFRFFFFHIITIRRHFEFFYISLLPSMYKHRYSFLILTSI